MRKRSNVEGTPQSGFGRSAGEMEYQRFQQSILDKTGVLCTVMIRAGIVSIRTENYIDFILARSAVRGMTSLDIIRAI